MPDDPENQPGLPPTYLKPPLRPELVRSKTDSYTRVNIGNDGNDDDSDQDETSNLLTRRSTPVSPGRGIKRGRAKRRLSQLFLSTRNTTTDFLSLVSPSASSYNLRTPRIQDFDVNPLNVSWTNVSSLGNGYGTTDDPNTLTPRRVVSTVEESKASTDRRGFYDDFTTVDWIHDTVIESSRRSTLKALPGLRGKFIRLFDAFQGWLLITIVAFAFTLVAYSIDACESVLSDLRHGYCSTNWFTREALCCPDVERFGSCPAWVSWSQYGGVLSGDNGLAFDFVAYLALTILFAYISVTLTLRTKTDIPLEDRNSALSKEKKPSLATQGAVLGESSASVPVTDSSPQSKTTQTNEPAEPSRRVIYSGTGSGVAEVKTILSGFIIRRFLGTYTLVHKSIGLIFSISSGLSVGKEGPYVHLAACVGNIACRLFKKFSTNEIKRRQVISAAASAGVALAFGSPLAGVLFSLEEVSYYFLPHQLFRIFFCAMISALFLIFMDPYKTGKIVLFEVTYDQNWQLWVSFTLVAVNEKALTI
ncbi:Gef1p [Sugiyamaella lignohabitans]|uniref:Gef1p n=1 Tax=Sugiyamaella lignohabitans TaxID=796027 RepID=A0A167DQA5_9ASCO|nr:Gef1p [Sugiyamaella lignohabitans]ANB13163.1 Gef1p [Sugiyamaella lignohabitans]